MAVIRRVPNIIATCFYSCACMYLRGTSFCGDPFTQKNYAPEEFNAIIIMVRICILQLAANLGIVWSSCIRAGDRLPSST